MRGEREARSEDAHRIREVQAGASVCQSLRSLKYKPYAVRVALLRISETRLATALRGSHPRTFDRKSERELVN
jgi:hypothetical protein